MLSPAVSLASVALTVHVAAVVVAFGPLFAYPALTAAVGRADADALAIFYRAQHAVARRVITPALPITLIAGVYLAEHEHAFGKAWVVVPMVVIVLLMALHRLVLIDGYRRLADGAGAGVLDAGTANSRLARRVTVAQLLSATLVLFTIFVMVAKPFA